jgi:hypothetical protein
MATQEDSGFKSFIATAAIPKYARVIQSTTAGSVTAAGLAEIDIGTAQNAAHAAGDPVTVKLRTAPGTHKGIASEAFAVGALLYTESDGEIQDTAQATAYVIGHALEAATADQDIVEFVYNSHGDTAAV